MHYLKEITEEKIGNKKDENITAEKMTESKMDNRRESWEEQETSETMGKMERCSRCSLPLDFSQLCANISTVITSAGLLLSVPFRLEHKACLWGTLCYPNLRITCITHSVSVTQNFCR